MQVVSPGGGEGTYRECQPMQSNPEDGAASGAADQNGLEEYRGAETG